MTHTERFGALVSEAEVAAALAALGEDAIRVRAPAWPGGLEGLENPGLYAWWVDSPGAETLSIGLDVEVPKGRIYAGQAGATAWPSGTKRLATLRTRIGGNHIRGSVRGSTFRLTLAAVLRAPLKLEVLGPRKLEPGSERRLTEWIMTHLEVGVHSFPDADRLTQLERRMLGSLDPPLNLEGMPRTPLRTRLSALRRELKSVPITPDMIREPRTPRAVVHGGAEMPEGKPGEHEGERVKLHEEIADILRSRGNRWMTTKEVAEEVNHRGRYHKRDGSEVTAFQIHGRTKNYTQLFERDGQRVRLLG